MIMRSFFFCGGAQVAILELLWGSETLQRIDKSMVLSEFAGKEEVLETSLFEGAFVSIDPDFTGLMLACENLSPAISETGRKAFAM